jgi:hypothetical protein
VNGIHLRQKVPLLCNNRKRGHTLLGNGWETHVNNSRANAKQLLGIWVPAATDTHATVEILLDYNNGNDVFYVVCYKLGQSSSGVRVSSSSVQ